MNQLVKQLVEHPWFGYTITALIVINAIAIGLETSPYYVENYGAYFDVLNAIILGAFIVEAVLKMVALAPRPWEYFKNGWNVFDFSIIVLSLLPIGGSFATLARLIRLLRVLRLISAFSGIATYRRYLVEVDTEYGACCFAHGDHFLHLRRSWILSIP